MARTARAPKIDSRTARLKLPARREPYWHVITPGCALGYRRIEGAGRSGAGTWIARHQDNQRRKRYQALGAADDILDGDGKAALSFAQAQERARGWFSAAADGGSPEAASAGPYTVADATRDYLAWFKDQRRSHDRTKCVVDTFIIPPLGKIKLRELTTARIRDWHMGLAASAPRVRSKKGEGTTRRELTKGDDARRARQATANRILTVLKAALNHAWRDGKASSDEAWRRVKPYHDVDAPVVRYLTEAECVRLVNATEAAFRPMVRAALLTGCRYGELVAMYVADFNPDSGTLAVRTSKSGKPRHVVLTDEGQRFFASLTAGRGGADLMFKRTDGEHWGKSHQARPLRLACKRAKITPAISFHVLRHTHGSQLAMRDVPMAVIAKQLGHAGTRMTEKHYAHLAPSYVAETIRAKSPIYGIVETGNVEQMAPKAGRG
jgi:integrase